ncbi:MAG: Tetratricopeptide repeat, partial [Fibrobacterota bacterium]
MSPLLTLGGLLALIPSLALAATHLETARQLSRSGSAAAAIPEYEAALEESPREPSLWMELGDARLQAGQAKAAAKAYQKALGLDPGRE